MTDILTIDDAIVVLGHAGMLQGRDELTRVIRDTAEEDRIAREVLYQMAQDENISPKNLEKALALYHPNKQQRIADLRKVNGKPTVEVIKREYQSQVLGALRATFPEKEFSKRKIENYERGGGVFSFDEVTRGTEVRDKGFLWWKQQAEVEVEKQKRWARFQIYSSGSKFNLNIELHGPLFLRACGDRLAEMNRMFKHRINNYSCESQYDL